MSRQLYGVLTPFKFGRAVIKPSMEFSATPEEAAELLEAGVIALASNTTRQGKEATPAAPIGAGSATSKGESDAGVEGRGEGAGQGPVAPGSSAQSRTAAAKAPAKKAPAKTTAAKATK